MLVLTTFIIQINSPEYNCAIYVIRDAEHTIQQDASHYIQALTFILIFGLISMIVVNVIQKRGS